MPVQDFLARLALTALGDVVEFYNQRFGIGFTEQQKADLVAFLNVSRGFSFLR